MTVEREHADDLRGASKLVVDATQGVTKVVQEMQQAIVDGPGGIARPFTLPASRLAGLVYGSIRGVTALVGLGLDRALAQVGPMLGASRPGPEREAGLAAINGVFGDWLEASKNPLAISSRLRSGGLPLTLERGALAGALPSAGGKIVVLIHGLSLNDLQWRRHGEDHGTALVPHGFTPVYAHYNSGRHISESGVDLDALLEQLVAAWPVPVEELVLLGHSMGGLVARSACAVADVAGRRWRKALRALICLGSPHHGAPLERGGNLLDRLLKITRYTAPLAKLGQIRSAGVTDLRFGNVLDAHWCGVDRFASGEDRRCPAPLPADVACHAVAASLPGTLVGDGLVPVDSALGKHPLATHDLGFPHQRVFDGVSHFGLLHDAAIRAQIVAWLTA
jgi:pimeloyl-ACP methyl ester carboxylesterase